MDFVKLVEQREIKGTPPVFRVGDSVKVHVKVKEGEKDRKHGKDFRPEKNDRYEDADHGYHKEYGSKDSFKMEYRQAFFRGYEDGYGRWRK